ncbi:hypothetical protein BJX63DRAFT_436115 [Aspergillus granulosus]|uniref:Uncharacterized protein n=1 Tax=Aspergillus granulosus TaxID=176169 RepID=A0ABR4GZ24_9EURO
MRTLTLLPTILLSGLALVSATPEAEAESAINLETRSSTTDLFLVGLSDVLLADDPSLIVKRQNTTSTSSPPPIGDALDDLLNGGFFGELLDLLQDSENIFTPEWNDRFGELVDSIAPLAYYIGEFLGQLLNSILNGGLGGGSEELPPLPTEPPSPTGTSDPGFEWPDLTWPIGGGDDGPTATATETPAPTSSDSGSSGFDFDFDIPSSSGDDTSDLGTGTETGTGDNSPTGTTPDEAQFTGVASVMRGRVGLAASAGFGVLIAFSVLG